MGRAEKSQGLAPPAVRKDTRAKQARHIINKVVPSILASNVRARKGAEESNLIVDPEPVTTMSATRTTDEGSNEPRYVKRKGQGRRKVKDVLGGEVSSVRIDRREAQTKTDPPFPQTIQLDISVPKRRIRILTTDTLSVVRILTRSSVSPRKQPNVCILNMASPLRPGGGVLTGATSQEEYLCSHTTLLPSLKESFYRLPELGGIFTRDVLVFRNHLPLCDSRGELGAAERFWVDVISAGMLRFPDLEGRDEEEMRLGRSDRKVVEEKMRAVLRIACARGVKRIVLGAWGCGAYGNPIRDIAEAWKAVIEGGGDGENKRRKGSQTLESWGDIQEFVFAISNKRMAKDFARAYGDTIQVEIVSSRSSDGNSDDNEEEETEIEAKELRAKIEELEGQVDHVWNSDLRQRMATILDGLRAQLQEHEGARDEEGGADKCDTTHGENKYCEPTEWSSDGQAPLSRKEHTADVSDDENHFGA